MLTCSGNLNALTKKKCPGFPKYLKYRRPMNQCEGDEGKDDRICQHGDVATRARHQKITIKGLQRFPCRYEYHELGGLCFFFFLLYIDCSNPRQISMPLGSQLEPRVQEIPWRGLCWRSLYQQVDPPVDNVIPQ